MQNSVKIAAIAFFAILPASVLAAPSISVTRTPASGNVWDAYSVTWNTSGAAKVGYRCSWAWNGVQDDISVAWLGTSGTVTGKYDDSMVWTTNCVWTATASDGSSATASESFSAVKNSSAPFSDFAITKISWKAVSGSATTLAVWTKSFSVEGVGAPGANVIVSSAGCVFLNQMANTDGSWSVTVQTGQYCKLPESGAFQFSVTASKAYYGEAVRYATVVIPASTQIEMGKIECRTGGAYADLNFYAERGASVTCTVSASDPKTKLKMDSGYVSWWDVESTKAVEPRSVSEMPTSCQDGVCTSTFVSDYAGYSKTRHVWFENSSGTKSYAISYVSADPTSKDYADGVEYLKNRYRTSGVPAAGGSGTWANVGLKVTSVEGAKYSGGKITASENVAFGFGGVGAKRSQIRLYRKGWDSDSVSIGADDAGKWSFFSLGTKWYPKVFKTGTNDYVVESVSSDGKTKSTATVTIEITGGSAASNGNTVTNGGNANQSTGDYGVSTRKDPAPTASTENAAASVAKFSPTLKKKLDAFAVLLEDNARSKPDLKASREYVSGVRIKLVTLKAKYVKAKKNASAAAIDYLIKKTDDAYVKFLEAEAEDTSLMKDLKESF